MLSEAEGWKNVSVGKLREILAALPADARIGVNVVSNLLVTSPDFSQLLGYVDLNEEHFETYLPGMNAS